MHTEGQQINQSSRSSALNTIAAMGTERTIRHSRQAHDPETWKAISLCLLLLPEPWAGCMPQRAIARSVCCRSQLGCPHANSHGSAAHVQDTENEFVPAAHQTPVQRSDLVLGASLEFAMGNLAAPPSPSVIERWRGRDFSLHLDHTLMRISRNGFQGLRIG